MTNTKRDLTFSFGRGKKADPTTDEGVMAPMVEGAKEVVSDAADAVSDGAKAVVGTTKEVLGAINPFASKPEKALETEAKAATSEPKIETKPAETEASPESGKKALEALFVAPPAVVASAPETKLAAPKVDKTPEKPVVPQTLHEPMDGENPFGRKAETILKKALAKDKEPEPKAEKPAANPFDGLKKDDPEVVEIIPKKESLNPFTTTTDVHEKTNAVVEEANDKGTFVPPAKAEKMEPRPEAIELAEMKKKQTQAQNAPQQKHNNQQKRQKKQKQKFEKRPETKPNMQSRPQPKMESNHQNTAPKTTKAPVDVQSLKSTMAEIRAFMKEYQEKTQFHRTKAEEHRKAIAALQEQKATYDTLMEELKVIVQEF